MSVQPSKPHVKVSYNAKKILIDNPMVSFAQLCEKKFASRLSMRLVASMKLGFTVLHDTFRSTALKTSL